MYDHYKHTVLIVKAQLWNSVIQQVCMSVLSADLPGNLTQKAMAPHQPYGSLTQNKCTELHSELLLCCRYMNKNITWFICYFNLTLKLK